MIQLKLLNNKQAEIITDLGTLEKIRTKFSIANPAYGKGRKFTPARLYAITPSGRFDIGLFENIKAYLESEQLFYKIDDSLENKLNIGLENQDVYGFTLMDYRDHQKKSIEIALKKGRGVFVIPTAGGKTFIMAGIIESFRKNHPVENYFNKILVIVPSIQLVEQTASDFIKYGLRDVTKWSGDNTPNPNAKIIVAGSQILLSEKTDLSILDDMSMLLFDEVHGLRRGNEINKVMQLVSCDYKFGFTGTMPPSLIDQWNIIGKIGPILYEEKTLDLKDKNYVSDFKIIILNIKHDSIPNFGKNTIRPTEAYNNEIEYLMNNFRRNEVIAKLASRLTSNTIIMVDRIDHGVNIELALKSICKEDRPIYFIRGSTEMEEREKIRKLMEERNDIIAVAVSKIFSTGINIPNLHNIIFASAGKAKIKIMQSIGRALRLHPTKSMATIFDIADNTKYSKTHLKERLKLYENEKYTYETKEI